MLALIFFLKHQSSFQEAADKPKFTSVISAENSMENVNSDDEDALRLAVLNTRDKRFAQRNSSHEAEEGEISMDSFLILSFLLSLLSFYI